MKLKPKMKNLPSHEYKNNMILGVRDKPKPKDWLILSIQHVFSMFGATVLLPILINIAAGETVITTDIALFSSGVGTLIYIICTRAKVPIYLGSSAAYVGTMGSLYPIYGNSMFFGLLGVGLIYLLVALAVYLFGTNWLKKLLPPVVVGPMIMIIGLSLASTAVSSMGINTIEDVNWWSILIVGITTISCMLIALLMKGKMKLLPILGGMIIGFTFALIISSWEDGIIDYDSTNWKSVDTYIGLPDFSNSLLAGKVAATVEGTNSKYSFMPFLLMMPIAFATISEHIGDHTVLGKITGRDYINESPGVHKTLIGDGLATIFGGVVGSAANTSYGENTTTIGLSRVGSVWVTGTAAVFAILMSFLKIISSVLGLIPAPVSGGLQLILFGFILCNGLKVMIDDKVDLSKVRNVFIISIMLIMGIGGATFGWKMGTTSVAFSGTSVAMLLGMLANLLLPNDRGIDMRKMPKAQTKGPYELRDEGKNKDWT